MMFAQGFIRRNKKKMEAERAAMKKKAKRQKAAAKKNSPSTGNQGGAAAENQAIIRNMKRPAAPSTSDHAHHCGHDHHCDGNHRNLNILGKLFSYFTSTIMLALYATLGFFVGMYHVIKLGLFDQVKTENGLKFYAEKPHPLLHHYLPMLEMPLNSLVNLGYVNIGLIIVAMAQRLVVRNKINRKDAFMYFIFGWSSFFYGHVQFWRIVLQRQHEAVMDQWVTLPIFSWTVAWTIHLLAGWSPLSYLRIVTVSTASYLLTWYTPIGFEISLGIHIFLAFFSGTTICIKYPSKKVQRYYWSSILMCCGFVGLKLVDLELPKYHPIFETVSGHFLSKVCDFAQIFYVARFFMHANLAKIKQEAEENKRKETQSESNETDEPNEKTEKNSRQTESKSE